MKNIFRVLMLLITLAGNVRALGQTSSNNVVISFPFEIYSTSTSSAYNYLCDKLPELLIEGIIYRSSSTYRSANDIRSTITLDKLRAINEAMGSDTIIKSNILDEAGANYLMKGTIVYQETESPKFSINVTVEDLKGNKYCRKCACNTDKDLYENIDNVCKYMNRAMMGRTNKKLYMAGFRSGANVFADKYSPYLFLSLSHIDTIDLAYHALIVPPETGVYTRIANDSAADFVVGGTVGRYNKKADVIRPVLYVRSSGQAINLDPVYDYSPRSRKKKFSRYYTALYALSNEVNDELRSLFEEASAVPEDKLVETVTNYIDSQNYDKARLYINQVKNSNNRLYLNSLLIFRRDRDYKVALDSIKNILDAEKDNDGVNMLAGQIFYNLGNYPQAAAKLTAIRSSYPNYGQALFTAASALARLESYDSARHLFQQQMLYTKDTIVTLIQIGNCFGDTDSAYYYFARVYNAGRRIPRNQYPLGNFYDNKALALYNRRQFDSAKGLFYKAYTVYPSSQYLKNIVMVGLKVPMDDNEYQDLASGVIRSDSARGMLKMASDVYYLKTLCLSGIDSNSGERSVFLQRILWGYKFYKQYANDTSAEVFQDIGVSYFDLGNMDSARYYYQVAYSKQPSPNNLFNLVEFLVTNNSDSLTGYYLGIAKNDTVIMSRLPDNRYNKLFYFYSAELLAKEGKDHKNESDSLNAALSNSGDMGNRRSQLPNVFKTWSFITFAQWVDTAIVNEERKRDMRALLCTVLPYTGDKGYADSYCRH